MYNVVPFKEDETLSNQSSPTGKVTLSINRNRDDARGSCIMSRYAVE